MLTSLGEHAVAVFRCRFIHLLGHLSRFSPSECKIYVRYMTYIVNIILL